MMNHVGYTKVAGFLPLKVGGKMTRIEAYRVALKMPFPAATGTLTLYVAFSHFSRSYLEKLWSQQVNTHRISWTMPAEQGQGHGFTDRVPHSNDDVYILPNVTLEVTDRALEELETKRAATERKGTKSHRQRGRLATDDLSAISIVPCSTI
jgi:hypothetical protein